jgi:HK97 family phage major capsid protein
MERRAAELVAAIEDEERRAYEVREEAAAEIGAIPGHDFDPRQALRLGYEPARRVDDLLGPGDKVAHVARARRNGGSLDMVDPSEIADPAAFNLGRIARAMVTESKAGLTELEQRALTEGTGSQGGFLIPEVLGPQVIDRVRNQMQVIAAGARTLVVESDSHALARLITGNVPGWRNEGAAVAESDQAYDRVTFTVKTLAILQKMSRELAEDLSPEANALIEGEIVQALALELDRVALRGTGTSPEPRGVLNQSGVTSIANGANGTALAMAMLTAAMSAVRDASHAPTAFLYASRTQKSLDSLVDTTGQPLRQPEAVAAVPKLVSNQVPVNLTVGSSTDCSEIYVGDWSELVIGIRPTVGLRVKVLEERFADTLQVGLLAWLRADVQLLHPAAFAVSLGIRP